MRRVFDIERQYRAARTFGDLAIAVRSGSISALIKAFRVSRLDVEERAVLAGLLDALASALDRRGGGVEDLGAWLHSYRLESVAAREAGLIPDEPTPLEAPHARRSSRPPG